MCDINNCEYLTKCGYCIVKRKECDEKKKRKTQDSYKNFLDFMLESHSCTIGNSKQIIELAENAIEYDENGKAKNDSKRNISLANIISANKSFVFQK